MAPEQALAAHLDAPTAARSTGLSSTTAPSSRPASQAWDGGQPEPLQHELHSLRPRGNRAPGPNCPPRREIEPVLLLIQRPDHRLYIERIFLIASSAVCPRSTGS